MKRREKKGRVLYSKKKKMRKGRWKKKKNKKKNNNNINIESIRLSPLPVSGCSISPMLPSGVVLS